MNPVGTNLPEEEEESTEIHGHIDAKTGVYASATSHMPVQFPTRTTFQRKVLGLVGKDANIYAKCEDMQVEECTPEEEMEEEEEEEEEKSSMNSTMKGTITMKQIGMTEGQAQKDEKTRKPRRQISKSNIVQPSSAPVPLMSWVSPFWTQPMTILGWFAILITVFTAGCLLSCWLLGLDYMGALFAILDMVMESLEVVQDATQTFVDRYIFAGMLSCFSFLFRLIASVQSFVQSNISLIVLGLVILPSLVCCYIAFKRELMKEIHETVSCDEPSSRFSPSKRQKQAETSSRNRLKPSSMPVDDGARACPSPLRRSSRLSLRGHSSLSAVSPSRSSCSSPSASAPASAPSYHSSHSASRSSSPSPARRCLNYKDVTPIVDKYLGRTMNECDTASSDNLVHWKCITVSSDGTLTIPSQPLLGNEKEIDMATEAEQQREA